LQETQSLDDRITQIGAKCMAALAQSAVANCLYPPKPWNILAKEFALESLDNVRVTRRIPGIRNEKSFWAEINNAEAWIREAVRAHRFARGTSAAQTFGSVSLKGGAA
jgi:hypothetical protein